MSHNSSNSRHNGTSRPGTHRVPEVAERSCPQPEPHDHQLARLSDTAAFKVLLKKNLPYQAIPDNALADLRARIEKLKD